VSDDRRRPEDRRPANDDSPADDDRRLDDRRWLDEPRNVTRIVYGLAVLCALSLVADFFYTKHPHFSIERWPSFYAVYGFVGSVTLVLTAKELRRLLRRDEDYYEPPEQDGNEQSQHDRNEQSQQDRNDLPERDRDDD
jgi:hypothetical protein